MRGPVAAVVLGVCRFEKSHRVGPVGRKHPVLFNVWTQLVLWVNSKIMFSVGRNEDFLLPNGFLSVGSLGVSCKRVKNEGLEDFSIVWTQVMCCKNWQIWQDTQGETERHQIDWWALGQGPTRTFDAGVDQCTCGGRCGHSTGGNRSCKLYIYSIYISFYSYSP